MIALDANVLVRYLVCDDPEQGALARNVLESLTEESPGFVCREVVLELVWVLERAYKRSRDEIAMVLEELTVTEHLVVEASRDVVRCAVRYREEDAGFADLMILAAAERAGSDALYTFDRKAAGLDGVTLLEGRRTTC